MAKAKKKVQSKAKSKPKTKVKASAKSKRPAIKAATKKAPSSKAAPKKGLTKKPLTKKSTNLEKVGIFGSYFNPVHVGHMQSMLEVLQKLGLKKVLVIPSNIPPHKEQSGPASEHRVEMVRRAIAPYSDQLELDTREIDRGGVSYTADTLSELSAKYDPTQLYLILGMDAFLGLDKWNKPAAILEGANIVVTTRFGYDAQFIPENFPDCVRQALVKVSKNKVLLKSGTSVELIEIEPVDASATQIRKKIRDGKDVKEVVQPQVLEYISANELYKRKSPLIDDYREFAKFCAERLSDKKAQNIKAYDLSKLDSFTEFTVICSGTSTRHASALAESLTQVVKECFGLHPLSVEGVREGRWILVDYGALVVHIFYEVVREEYRLEQLWRGGSEIPLDFNKKQSERSGDLGI